MFDYSDLLNKLFEYGGRGPDSYDCYGLMIELNKRLNRFMPPDYMSNSDCVVISNEINKATQSEFIEITRPKSYCLVTFFIVPKITSHIGMVLPNLYEFIHILNNTSVTKDRLDSMEWSRRITGYWEHVSWK